MRLHRFAIVNFKAIQNMEFEWEDLLVLLGENNCGKSCVLSALSVFLSGSAVRDQLLFHRYMTDEVNSIELTGYFDQLSDIELNETSIKGRTHLGEWILKKKFWLEKDASDDGLEKTSWKEQLLTYSAPEVFTGWPSPDNTWGSFGPEYQPMIAKIPGSPLRPNAANREILKQFVRDDRPDLVTQGAPA
jgi:energy-coupling factor transporter ATP-binding protein EcfA2